MIFTYIFITKKALVKESTYIYLQLQYKKRMTEGVYWQLLRALYHGRLNGIRLKQENTPVCQLVMHRLNRVWRIPFFDWIQILNIIRFSEITKYRTLNAIWYWENPNTEYQILFSIEKIWIPNSTIWSNYSNTKY